MKGGYRSGFRQVEIVVNTATARDHRVPSQTINIPSYGGSQ